MARILYIEGTSGLGLSLKHVVEARGHAVELAPTGEAGLRRHGNDPFDLVAVDDLLPDLSALETARTMLAGNSHLPLLIITGKDNVHIALETLAWGITNYILKDSENLFMDMTPGIVDNLLDRSAEWQRLAGFENEAAEHKSVFRELIENFDHGIFIHRDYRPLFVNSALVRIFGYGSTADVMALDGIDQLYAPGERERMKGYLAVRMGGSDDDAPSQYMFQGLRKDGAVIWLERSSQTVLWEGAPAVLGSVFDVTERAEMEQSLNSSEKRFRDFAAAASDWFWETDDELRFSYFSDRNREITGFDPSIYLGKTRRDVSRENTDGEEWQRHFDDLDNRRPFRDFRYDLTTADGRRMTISVNGTPVFDDGGKFRGYRGTGSDISDQRRAEETRDQAVQEAENANRAKSEFLATMSHEFRTPLNAILGFSEVLRTQVLGPLGDEKYTEYADDIHESGELMLALINDILDISAIEVGKRTVNQEAVDVADVIAGCIRNFDLMSRENGVTLDTEIASDLPVLMADRRSIIQIIQNLLSNAIKFTESGGRVTVSTFVTEAGLCLTVRDSGIGIPPDKLANVTEPFSQTSVDPHVTQSGTGLGLAIVKSLVEAHEGTMRIDSEPGAGTRVTLCFPVADMTPD